MIEHFANNWFTALASAVDATATAFSVEDASLCPATPFTAVVDLEYVSVTAVTDNVLSVTRGQNSSTAAEHSAGATLANVVTAEFLEWLAENSVYTANIGIDNSGTAIPSDSQVIFQLPPGTILSYQLVADQAGDLVLDLWKDSFANYPPTVDDTITASAKPTLSNAVSSSDSTLTGWTTSISEGDWLVLNVDSCTTITRFTLAVKVQRL